MKEAMRQIAIVHEELRQHKADTEKRFKEITLELDSKVSLLQRQADAIKTMLHTKYPAKEKDEGTVGAAHSIRTTPTDNYKMFQIGNGIYALTNGYQFTVENGNDADSFIELAVVGKDGIIRWNRNAEGITTQNGRKTNTFVAAMPLFTIGCFNGREASNQYSLPVLPSVRRQYDYPAYDLNVAAKSIGLPSRLEDLQELAVHGGVHGSFYGANGFLDLYLHDLDHPNGLAGYRGTLNAIDGAHTKAYNINLWFHRPEQTNADGLAGGWTGAVKIGERIINGVFYEIGIKIERGSGDEFIYICLVPKSNNVIDTDIYSVLAWVQDDLQLTLDSSPTAQALIATMARKPVPVHKGLALCGLHVGAEIWWSMRNKIQQLVFKDLRFTINGRTYHLDGTVTGGKIAAPVVPTPPQTGTDNGGILVSEIELGLLRKRTLTFGGKALHLGNHPEIIDIKRELPKFVIKPLIRGTTDVKFAHRDGREGIMRITVK